VGDMGNLWVGLKKAPPSCGIRRQLTDRLRPTSNGSQGPVTPIRELGKTVSISVRKLVAEKNQPPPPGPSSQWNHGELPPLSSGFARRRFRCESGPDGSLPLRPLPRRGLNR